MPAYIQGYLDENGDLKERIVDSETGTVKPDTEALRAKIKAATNTTTLKSALLDVLDVIETREV